MSPLSLQKLFWLLLAIAVLAPPPSFAMSHGQPSSPPTAAATNDFVEYWGAAHLLITGQNPYSVEQLYSVQRSLGWPDKIPLIMWNPPWTLTFIVPFALIDFSISQILWLIVLTAVILFCALRLWALYGGPDRLARVAWLVTLSFVPTYFVLLREQIGPLILLGTVGFLYFQKREQWMAAGAMLVLLAIKPHLVYLLWAALLFWTLEHRRWEILIGAIGAGVVAISLPLIFNPAVFHQYVQLHLTAPPPTPFDWSTPTIGRALREFLVVEGIWLQLLPTVCGLIWFIFYWKRHHLSWNWLDQFPLLLLVSVATSFFGWVLDQIILLPALLQGAAWIAQKQPPRILTPAVGIYALINGLSIGIKFFSPYDFWYFWLAWAWLFNFILLRHEIAPASSRQA